LLSVNSVNLTSAAAQSESPRGDSKEFPDFVYDRASWLRDQAVLAAQSLSEAQLSSRMACDGRSANGRRRMKASYVVNVAWQRCNFSMRSRNIFAMNIRHLSKLREAQTR